jgi:hypothetical protein
VKLEKPERSAKVADLAVAVYFPATLHQHKPRVSRQIRASDVAGALIAGGSNCARLTRLFVQWSVPLLKERELVAGVRQIAPSGSCGGVIRTSDPLYPTGWRPPAREPGISDARNAALDDRGKCFRSPRTRHVPSSLRRKAYGSGATAIRQHLVEAAPYLDSVSIRETLAAELRLIRRV